MKGPLTIAILVLFLLVSCIHSAEARCNWEQAYLLAQINRFRVRNGFLPVIYDAQLAAVAEVHCRDMINRNYFGHKNPEGQTVAGRLAKRGLKYTYIIELLAGAQSVDIAMSMWQKSLAHCRSLLSSKMAVAGTAAIQGGKYGAMYVVVFALR